MGLKRTAYAFIGTLYAFIDKIVAETIKRPNELL